MTEVVNQKSGFFRRKKSVDITPVNIGRKVLRDEGVLDRIPVAGTAVKIFIGSVPHSIMEGIVMDVSESLIGLLPVVGDVLTGGIRTARYATSTKVPLALKPELAAISLVDTAIGSIPLVGDVIDMAMFTNTYSYIRISRHKHEKISFIYRKRNKQQTKEITVLQQDKLKET
jgi:hypothetical protein